MDLVKIFNMNASEINKLSSSDIDKLVERCKDKISIGEIESFFANGIHLANNQNKDKETDIHELESILKAELLTKLANEILGIDIHCLSSDEFKDRLFLYKTSNLR